jgi:hypothetical protein
VEHAIALFRDRHATMATNRDATAPSRTSSDSARSCSSDDESALFDIANNFEIRHLNER